MPSFHCEEKNKTPHFCLYKKGHWCTHNGRNKVEMKANIQIEKCHHIITKPAPASAPA
jgi:hypothetical protein